VLSAMIAGPTWTQATQTLTATSQPKPWIYYDGVLDPNSPRFMADFIYCSNRSVIQQEVAAALDAVRLENQIRVLARRHHHAHAPVDGPQGPVLGAERDRRLLARPGQRGRAGTCGISTRCSQRT